MKNQLSTGWEDMLPMIGMLITLKTENATPVRLHEDLRGNLLVVTKQGRETGRASYLPVCKINQSQLPAQRNYNI